MQACRICEVEKPITDFRYREDRRVRVRECKPYEQAIQKVNYRKAKQRDPIKWRVQTLRLNRSKHITLEWLEEKLLEQGHCCALSGRPINVLTLEVDHIVARCAGGTDELINLRLVCRDANAAKGALTDAELLSLCCDILRKLSEGRS